MAALPPDFNDNEEKPTIQVIKMPERSFTERAWDLAGAVAVGFITLAIFAYIALLCWNSLAPITTLPEIDWETAFTALVLVRVVGLTFNH